MGKVSLFIDGKEIQAQEGMSVLDAALAADMGDYMFLARFPTLEMVIAFYDKILAER